MVRKLPDYPQDFARAMERSTSPEAGWSGQLRVFMTIALVMVFVGLVLEQLTTRRLLRRLYAQLVEPGDPP